MWTVAGGGRVVRAGRDVPEPRVIHTEAPYYSAIAHAAGIEGIVEIEVTIAVDGTVKVATVSFAG